jgi:hypothetical protein
MIEGLMGPGDSSNMSMSCVKIRRALQPAWPTDSLHNATVRKRYISHTPGD